jgi:hypothetical protein
MLTDTAFQDKATTDAFIAEAISPKHHRSYTYIPGRNQQVVAHCKCEWQGVAVSDLSGSRPLRSPDEHPAYAEWSAHRDAAIRASVMPNLATAD